METEFQMLEEGFQMNILPDGFLGNTKKYPTGKHLA